LKRRHVIGLLVLLGIGALGAGMMAAVPRLPDRKAGVPTAKLTKGPLRLNVNATGDLRAGRTMTLVAPPVGGMLRIVKMIPTGIPVKEGEIVLEFDPADQQFTLEQSRSDVAEAEQEIAKMKADAAAQSAQDEVSMLTACMLGQRLCFVAINREMDALVQALQGRILDHHRFLLRTLLAHVDQLTASICASLSPPGTTNSGQGRLPAIDEKCVTSGPGPPSAAAPSTSAATSGCSSRYSLITACPSPTLTEICGILPLSENSAPAAPVAITSARSRASSSIVACTPAKALNSCRGTMARMCTEPWVSAARRAAKRNARVASSVSSMMTR